MQKPGPSNGENVSVERTTKENAETKRKLLREIRELRSIIEQCEWKLSTPCFKDVEGAIQRPSVSRTSRHAITPNTEVKLQNDLYRFAGLHCVSFKRKEFVFNFTSTSEARESDVYGLQISIKDGKGSLGKWVMPMSIDMNRMLTQIPIDKLKNIGAFVKNCKHNIDCYTARREQFVSLKEYISDVKNCTLQSNIGYTYVSLEICGVQNVKDNEYVNLIVYLLYRSEEARPYKIDVDTTDRNKLNDGTKQRLKAWVKEFKISDLRTAFDKISKNNDSAFTWMQIDGAESPLELNDTSSSEEGIFEQLQSDRKRSLKKAKRKRELQKKWKERKRQQGIESNVTPAKDNSDDGPATKALRTNSPRQLIKKKRPRKVASLLERREEINREDIPKETTPMNKSKIGLKQTKLNFHINQTTNSDGVDSNPLFQSKQRAGHDSKRKTAKLFTSTPLHRNVKDTKALSLSSSLDNITSIEPLPKQTTSKLNKSKDESFPEGKNTPEGNISKRLRGNAARSSQRLSPAKNDQRLTKNMRKI